MIMQFFLFGLFGRQLLELIKNENGWNLLGSAVILAASIAACCIIIYFQHKKAFLAVPLVVVAYISLLGLICLAAMVIVWIIFKWLARDADRPVKQPTSKDDAKDRKAALDYVVMQAYELEDYLDDRAKLEFQQTYERLLYDESATASEIYSAMSHWDIYRNNPMNGSKEWKIRHEMER